MPQIETPHLSESFNSGPCQFGSNRYQPNIVHDLSSVIMEELRSLAYDVAEEDIVRARNQDGSLGKLILKRYRSFDSEFGALIEAGKADFETLEKKAMEWGEPTVASGKQELVEMIFQSAL